MWIVSYDNQGCFKQNKELLQKSRNYGQKFIYFRESRSRSINFCGSLLYRSDEKQKIQAKFLLNPLSKQGLSLHRSSQIS